MDKKEYAIIVAGGKGSRMNSDLPKQFLALHGKPILMHTLEAFHNYSSAIEIILVLPLKDIDTWKSLCKKHNFSTPYHLTIGGNSRFQSVKNGLNSIQDSSGLVAIHDGVRPLISTHIIDASFRIAAAHKSAVAAVRLKESIRVTTQDTTQAVDRALYRLIQTPQTFDLELIRQAYEIDEVPSLTDDASVAEKAGHKISLFEGSYDNIKVTTPEDLIIAEALMNRKNNG
ncbi:2-C-methyl-D-erythritol 4-phosphate cytidylyltransferase [Fulvivirga sediminis]|uniref:2-C-methyl-D-erythritol 4-phosphate cytidylyltransferase n=1 Tax=Fulvivirga sediminis TaxID=2803949 RepID=A0A937F5H0_9BACT|nr:2-C-methyl-D-erythritol 4-phosphate cytidylyltransferase [Fulvivirga sediminis]MBL3656736.1 2-C-methyl-D-erythritol 4-phosphate cytidylyltransferase [Fulvivirga sediminis]